MYLADTLSRAQLPETSPEQLEQICSTSAVRCEAEAEIERLKIEDYLPMSDKTATLLRTASEKDKEAGTLTALIKRGWPKDKRNVPIKARRYFELTNVLSVNEGIIFKGDRTFVPVAARRQMMDRIHISHAGIQTCIRRARETMYWPNMNEDIKEYVSRCTTCAVYQPVQQKETLQYYKVPTRPWERIGCDLMEFAGWSYLVTVDYYSDFIECDRVHNKPHQKA